VSHADPVICERSRYRRIAMSGDPGVSGGDDDSRRTVQHIVGFTLVTDSPSRIAHAVMDSLRGSKRSTEQRSASARRGLARFASPCRRGRSRRRGRGRARQPSESVPVKSKPGPVSGKSEELR